MDKIRRWQFFSRTPKRKRKRSSNCSKIIPVSSYTSTGRKSPTMPLLKLIAPTTMKVLSKICLFSTNLPSPNTWAQSKAKQNLNLMEMV